MVTLVPCHAMKKVDAKPFLFNAVSKQIKTSWNCLAKWNYEKLSRKIFLWSRIISSHNYIIVWYKFPTLEKMISWLQKGIVTLKVVPFQNLSKYLFSLYNQRCHLKNRILLFWVIISKSCQFITLKMFVSDFSFNTRFQNEMQLLYGYFSDWL